MRQMSLWQTVNKQLLPLSKLLDVADLCSGKRDNISTWLFGMSRTLTTKNKFVLIVLFKEFVASVAQIFVVPL